MKIKIALCSFLLTGINFVSAQQAFNTKEFLDINNIKAAHLVHGDMWHDPVTATQLCEFPKGSGKHVAFLGSLWMSGLDQQNSLRVSSQMYRQNNQNDYWPGPADDPNYTVDSVRAKAWAKIWKINRSTIDSFRNLATHTVANTPAAIITWPAKGNSYAMGAGTYALTINRDMAPFIDVNNDGIYNPLAGDYPAIKGDQMLWWIENDLGPTHNESLSNPLRVEVHNMAYAYLRGGKVDNILFYEFEVVNRSMQSYSNYRLGFNADPDLGYGFDDYLVLDTPTRTGIVFNAKTPDGNGEPTSYGTTIPIAGITMLEQPSDQYPANASIGSFISYDNDALPNGNPNGGMEFHYLLNGYNRAGTFTDYHNFYSTQSTPCSTGLPYKDRRFIFAGKSVQFNDGQSLKYAYALVISPNGGGCPNQDFTGILSTADTAIIVYHNPPAPTRISNISKTLGTLNIYPNPAIQLLNVNVPYGTDGKIKIYDATGKEISLPVIDHGSKVLIETGFLAPGIYMIEYRSAKTVANNIFVKQ